MQQVFPGVYLLKGEIGGRPLQVREGGGGLLFWGGRVGFLIRGGGGRVQRFEALMRCRYDVYREDHGILRRGCTGMVVCRRR